MGRSAGGGIFRRFFYSAPPPEISVSSDTEYCSGDQGITSEVASAPVPESNTGVQLPTCLGQDKPGTSGDAAGIPLNQVRHLPRSMRRRLHTRKQRARFSALQSETGDSSEDGHTAADAYIMQRQKCRRSCTVILHDKPPGHLRPGIHGRSICSVIEADMTDPNCAVCRGALEGEFADVLQLKHLMSEDVANKLLRPYYEATITLKQGAEGKSVQPFSCLSLRHCLVNSQKGI
mmetsp:Transcript_11382/g.17522  ORF Transcript_11382/g.17522 Transcript_11382/m.17522 type:complete len:233 (-) Transcript_11382:23-721(-)